MNKILLSFVISLFAFSYLVAQPRNAEKAEVIAKKFVSNKVPLLSSATLSSFTYNRERMMMERSSDTIGQEQMPFYIFSDSSSTAFVIVSGDIRMKEILAFGDHFPTGMEAEMPEGLVWLMESYRQQFELLQTGSIVSESVSTTITIPDVLPLLKTKWRQGTPYNNLCPKGCPSGCVATAMSQVMNFHQYPASGNGSFSYTSRSRRFRCSYNFGSASFQWDKLRNTYPTSTLGEIPGGEEIAQVTYACGVSVGMDYDTDGSGAYMSDVPYALIHFFGYNDNVSYRDRTCYNATEWYDMLCKELVEGRPVIYGGVDSRNGGHAFVIEGCNSQTRKFNVNWGWGGDFDGEYELDALDPTTYRFSSYQSMIVNISPQLVGDYEDVFYAEKFTAPKEIMLEKNLNFTMNDVYCYASQSSYVVSSAKFKGEIGVAVFDSDFNYVTSIDAKTVEGINNFDGYTKLSFSGRLTRSMFPENGTYYIAPYAKARLSAHPTRIRTNGGRTDYVTVVLTEDDISDGNDNDNPEETLSVWSEDFEFAAVPKGWSQRSELGEGLWKHRYVLQPSEDMPLAAKGKGYISLEYATSMQDRYNTRTVTRLETSIIPLSEKSGYDLTLQYRKYATLPESTDLITIYYEKNREWHLLSEIPVTNQGEWASFTMQLPVNGNIRLAFEGSPSKGSIVFLDDLLISERKEATNITPLLNENITEKAVTIYNLAGVKMAEMPNGDLKHVKFKDGYYIIRQHNKTRKILIKNSLSR